MRSVFNGWEVYSSWTNADSSTCVSNEAIQKLNRTEFRGHYLTKIKYDSRESEKLWKSSPKSFYENWYKQR